MTLNEIVQIIYRRLEQSTDYPESTSDDYALIKGAINDAIEKWGGMANEQSTKWRELFKNLSVASTGDKTTTANDSTYAMPNDFIEISSWVKVTDSDNQAIYYKYKKQDDVVRALAENASDRFFYITGYPENYILNINPAPSATGNTISYSYYKKPSLLSATTDEIEMSRPYFAVYDALATLLEEERPDLAQSYLVRASSVMDEMIIANEIPPFNTNNQMTNYDYEVNGAAFGL